MEQPQVSEYEYKRKYITNEGIKEYTVKARRERGMKKIVLRDNERKEIIKAVTEYFESHEELPKLEKILEELQPKLPLLKKWYLAKVLRELKKNQLSLPCDSAPDSTQEEKCEAVDSMSSV